MSQLSEYLNSHIPQGWSKGDVIDAMANRADRTTVYRYLSGRHPRRPSEALLEAFAEVLPGVSLVKLREAAGSPGGSEEPWVLPPEANRLNAGQRRAIEAFIRATVAANDESAVADELGVPSVELTPAADTPIAVTASARSELELYVEQLHATGRSELADRLAATLVGGDGDVTSTGQARARLNPDD